MTIKEKILISDIDKTFESILNDLDNYKVCFEYKVINTILGIRIVGKVWLKLCWTNMESNTIEEMHH